MAFNAVILNLDLEKREKREKINKNVYRGI